MVLKVTRAEIVFYTVQEAKNENERVKKKKDEEERKTRAQTEVRKRRSLPSFSKDFIWQSFI